MNHLNYNISRKEAAELTIEKFLEENINFINEIE